jgi:hypothetical protein
MKKIYKLLFFLCVLFSYSSIFSQVASNYTWSQSSGTYTPVSGGTLVASGNTLDAQGYSVTFPTAFVFNGTSVTTATIKVDGYIALGVASFSSTSPLSSSTAATGIISAMGCDLQDSKEVGAVPEIRMVQVGNEIIIQWDDFRRYTSTAGVNERFDFQIRLNTLTGLINMVYSLPTNVAATTSYIPQVGLRGTVNSDYNARRLTTTVPDSSPSWDDTAPATSNGQNVRFTTTVPAAIPDEGRTFTYTPASCLAPSGLVVSNITSSSATIGWTASGSALTYDWELRTTGSCGSGSPIQSGNTASTSVNLLTLTANTTYTYCVRSACTGPTESGWVSGTFTTSCTSTTPPYTQDFESVTTPAIPACTSIQNAGTGNNWTTNSPSSYGFTSKALRYSYNTINDANAWFFTQGLTLTTGTSYKLTYKYGSAGYDESLKVNIGTSPNAAAMTTNLADHPLVTTSPLTNTVYFTVPSNGTYYVGYNAYSIADQFYLFVDDINIIVAPTCDGPSGIVASAITQNSATISWTAPAPPPASGYDYIYSTSSTPPTGMSTPSGSTGAGITTTNLTSLTSSTLYYVWVRSVCSGVDKSNWVAMPSFTTSVDCSTAPVLSCATPVTSGNLAVAGGLLNDGTCAFSTPGNEKLYSFTSTTAGSYTLNITNVNGGFGYIDYQFKLASAGCGAGGWTCIGDRSSVGTTTFTLAAATQYFILLDAESASSTANHTFQIDCPVACPAPLSAAATGITTNSANANWTPTSGDFIIEYGPTSTFGTPGTGATAGNVNNFVVTATNVGTKALLGLLSSTGYSYVIRLDCTGAGNGYSANSTVRTFTTAGTPPANDECIDAINLTPTDGYFTNPGLQNMANSLPTTVLSDCVFTTNNKQDVWYKLTSDNDGNMGEHINLTVTPTGISDIVIMLYGGSCGTLTELDCSDNGLDGDPETIVYTEVPFTGGELETRGNIVYYLRVMDYFNDNGQFNISALGSTALPVNILSFDAKSLNNKTVQLTWNVAAEVDVREYIVERSNDNRNWSAIGSVKASQKSTYGFNDNSPVSGVNYYRLAVKDVNASVAYSDIRTVNFSGKRKYGIVSEPCQQHFIRKWYR